MLPIDFRSEEFSSDNEVWVSIHDSDNTYYTSRISSEPLSDDDLRLLCDSLDYMLNKYNEALEYIKSKQNTL